MKLLYVALVSLFLISCTEKEPIEYPEGTTQETQIPGDDMTISKNKRIAPKQAKQFCEELPETELCKP